MKQTPVRLADSNPGSFLLFTIVAMIGSSAVAQNLVPNGGFEEGITCPSFVGNVTEECAFWYASIAAPVEELPTPDWFHICSEVELYSPPELVFGYQEPYSGGGLIGLIAFSGQAQNAREIIGVELTEPLVQGNTYLVQYMVSGMEREGVAISSNNMGFNFSTNQFYALSGFPLNFSHFASIDLLPIGEWIAISEEFVADSAYNYLHIGNFYDDSYTIADTTELPGGKSYYAIDDVSVTELLSSGNSTKFEDSLVIHPNPVSNKLKVQTINGSLEISKILVSALNGELVKTFEFNIGVTQSELDLTSLNQGIYILQIVTPKTIFYEKIIKM